MNQDIFLPYGLDENEEIVHISQVESGRSSLSCPFCDAPLIAKKGTRLSHHFAHAGNTCKEVAGGAVDSLSLSIPFYSDVFSSQLSDSEKRALQILYKAFGKEYFHRKGKENSAFQLLFQNGIQKLSQVWERLLSAQQLEEKGNWFQLTSYAEAGLGVLPISVFARIQEFRLYVFESILEEGHDSTGILRKKIYHNLKNRLLQATLYCLHIPGQKGQSAVWKIGMTSRTAEQRLKELSPAIIHQFGEKRARATYIACEIPGMGRLEAYIKKRFAASQLPFTYNNHVYTEFFTNPNLIEELKILQA
ncbi:MAG: GIY-YIG nuclease family protein [Bacteroidota bacterium]